MKAYERLIRYAAFPTASNESSETCPSTPEQRVFADSLVEELNRLGLTDAHADEYGYVYASLPSNTPRSLPTIGFIAHMDVVSEVPYSNIKPRIVKDYDGGDILLNEEKQIYLKPSEYTSLHRYIGKTLIVTDGTTLLGADDKAGIAEIMTMAEYLTGHPDVEHGNIRIAFTPDEEIGRGADHFDVAGFSADYAYTADGAAFGEVEYETFNAASLEILFTGRSIHPGSAKNTMINAALAASEYLSLLPAMDRPEYTEGREGFYHVTEIEGCVEKAVLKIIIRDHSRKLFEYRKNYALRAVEEINRRYGYKIAVASLSDSYYNMKEMIMPHFEIVEHAAATVRRLGGEPISLPVRGGTDGSRLSFMGLPCPNLGTGSHNHHGCFEYAVAEEMERAVEMLIMLASAPHDD